MKSRIFSFISAFGLLSATLGGIVSGGCGGVSVSSICEEICTCQRCTSNDLESCENDGEELQEQADDAGCRSQFDDFLSCAKDNVHCQKDKAIFDGCLAEAAALDACGGGGNPLLDPCQLAGDKIIVCLDIPPSPNGEPPVDCSGSTACSADCINMADCDAIKDAFSGAPTGVGQAFLDCLSACSGSSGGGSSGSSGSSGG